MCAITGAWNDEDLTPGQTSASVSAAWDLGDLLDALVRHAEQVGSVSEA